MLFQISNGEIKKENKSKAISTKNIMLMHHQFLRTMLKGMYGNLLKVQLLSPLPIYRTLAPIAQPPPLPRHFVRFVPNGRKGFLAKETTRPNGAVVLEACPPDLPSKFVTENGIPNGLTCPANILNLCFR